MNLEYTKSNLSFLSSRLLQISSWINSIFCLEVMLRLQYSKYLLSISTPTTCPVSPTILAISLVTEPEPHPISIQLLPFFRPAFKRVCFVIGSNKVDWISSLAISLSRLPKIYLSDTNFYLLDLLCQEALALHR